MQCYEPILDRKIRLALVGCGRIASNHFAAIEQHSDRVELLDVCDLDPDALHSASALTGARGFQSLPKLLESTEADLVILTTPSGLHPEQTIQVARSGRHVMTEKPMATRWRDGQAMVKACDEANVRLFVGRPTQQYPHGYWKIEKFDGKGWQRLDPRTMKPGTHPDSHVPLPENHPGPFTN